MMQTVPFGCKAALKEKCHFSAEVAKLVCVCCHKALDVHNVYFH